MKNYLVLFLILFFYNISKAQVYWGENFEGTLSQSEHFYLDTVTDPDSKWLMGSPDKTNINAAFSGAGVMITDTLNPVPSNDTSQFYVWHYRDVFQPFFVFILHFKFNLDGDTNDIGMIELSPDTGNTWYNLMELDSVGLLWLTPKPELRGNSGGWQSFDLDMMNWDLGGNQYVDTILFRFTYITDSSATGHDGWAIDEFLVEDWFMGLEEFENNDLVSIYPNPAADELFLERMVKGDPLSVQILNYQGQSVYFNGDFKSSRLDVHSLENGIYFLRSVYRNEFSVKRFIVQH